MMNPMMGMMNPMMMGMMNPMMMGMMNPMMMGMMNPFLHHNNYQVNSYSDQTEQNQN